MAQILPDEIVINIVARLPTKPFLRFRCVSEYWNRVLNEPYIMKLRSRRMIILSMYETLHLIDDNLPIQDESNSIVKRCYPLENLRPENTRVSIVGSFNGIVLLAYEPTMVLYNPFTGASTKLPDPPSGHNNGACGFGYGENPDDLKIFWFRESYGICDVYSFKNSSWSPWITSQYTINRYVFQHIVGKFLNGFLHWVTCFENMLAFLDVKDMVVSYIRLRMGKYGRQIVLGTTDGCLCTLNQISMAKYSMYVMKEHGNEDSWTYTYLFTLADSKDYVSWRIWPPGCILDNGKILVETPSRTDYLSILEKGMENPPSKQLIIYSPLKHSYKEINIYRLLPERGRGYWKMNNVVEYVESLVSPSDMCTFLGNGKP